MEVESVEESKGMSRRAWAAAPAAGVPGGEVVFGVGNLGTLARLGAAGLAIAGASALTEALLPKPPPGVTLDADALDEDSDGGRDCLQRAWEAVTQQLYEHPPAVRPKHPLGMMIIANSD